MTEPTDEQVREWESQFSDHDLMDHDLMVRYARLAYAAGRKAGLDDRASARNSYELRLKSLDTQLAAKGCERGMYQAQWRGMVNGRWQVHARGVERFDANDAMLAVLDALIHQGGMDAWDGDGTGCVVQMLQVVYAERDALKAEVEALRADADRYRWLRNDSLITEALRAGFAGPICVLVDKWGDPVRREPDGLSIITLDGKELDAAIDAAREHDKP